MPFEQLLKSSKTYSRRYPVVPQCAFDEFVLSEYKDKKKLKKNGKDKIEERERERSSSRSSHSSSSSTSSFVGFDSDDLLPATFTPPPQFPSSSSSSYSVMAESDEGDRTSPDRLTKATNNDMSSSVGQTRKLTLRQGHIFLDSSSSNSASMTDGELRNPSWLKSSSVMMDGRRISKRKKGGNTVATSKGRRPKSKGGKGGEKVAVENSISETSANSPRHNDVASLESPTSNKDANVAGLGSTLKVIECVDRDVPSDGPTEQHSMGPSDLIEMSYRHEKNEAAEFIRNTVIRDSTLSDRIASERRGSEELVVSTNETESFQSPVVKSRLSSRRTILPRFTCEGEISARVSTSNSHGDNQFEFSFLSSCDKNAARRQLLDLCGQKAPRSFEFFFSKTDLGTCKKIGEGTFGEVFSIEIGGRLTAVKVMPIEGDRVNGEEQKSYADMLSELNVTRALSNLRNGIDQCCSTFMEVYGIHFIHGKYPKQMRDEWYKYAKVNDSENDPSILSKKQLFIALVTEYCGLDLEKFKVERLNQVESIVRQLCLSLAVAERKLQFEHRDLHLGNVLVNETSDETLSFRLDGKEHLVTTHGVKANIVDYSLSRVTIGGFVFYVNLESEKELFEGIGDSQYDVYRSMREINGNKWRAFHPSTNVHWLRFISSKLTDGNRWKMNRLRTLKGLTDQIGSCKSAVEIVKKNCEESDFERTLLRKKRTNT